MDTDTTSSSKSSRFPSEPNPSDTMGDSFKAAMGSVGELRAYFDQYLAAKIDGAKASARLMVLYAFLSVFGIIVAGTATVTATVLLVLGVAGGLGAAMDNNWLANLLVGILFIVVIAVGMSVGYPLLTGRLRRGTVRKYEAMRRKQDMHFGHHAQEKAHGRV